jgi:hypothetical protein
MFMFQHLGHASHVRTLAYLGAPMRAGGTASALSHENENQSYSPADLETGKMTRAVGPDGFFSI